MDLLRVLTIEEYRVALIGLAGVLAGSVISVLGVFAQVAATTREARRERLRLRYAEALEVRKRAQIAADRVKSAEDGLARTMQGSQVISRHTPREGEEGWEGAAREVLIESDVYREALNDCMTMAALLDSAAPVPLARCMQFLLIPKEDFTPHVSLLSLSAIYVRCYAGNSWLDRRRARLALMFSREHRRARARLRTAVRDDEKSESRQGR